MAVRPRLGILVLILVAVGACASPASSTPTTAPATPTPTVESDTSSPSTEPSESAEATESSEAAELDMSLPSNFGSTDLSAGFTPDPFSVELVSGGPIDVTYVGDDCRGYATEASDYDVTYTAVDEDLLRFYFVADTADTTLVINAPDGSWHCNDDAPGTIDPLIDFVNPESGRYDIWIGSYESGTENSGTLYVTETESNGP